MPLVVGWDMSTGTGVLAAGRGGRLLAEEHHSSRARYTGWLMPAIISMVSDCGASRTDISLLVAGTGPGSYSGVKAGVSTARALAAGLGIPLAGVPTLDLLAASLAGRKKKVLLVMGAGRDKLYTAAYRPDGLMMCPVAGYRCLEPGEVDRMVLSLGWKDFILAGQPPPGLEEAFIARGAGVETVLMSHPRGTQIIEQGIARLEEGLPGSPLDVLPVYLRSPV